MSDRVETNVNSQVPTPNPNIVPNQSQDPLLKLLSLPITNENDALNVAVSFLNVAQRRGVFSIDESAKIWEAIKVFQRLQ
jgi:hypothetical protein